MPWRLLAFLLTPAPEITWVAPPTCPDAASIELRLVSADVQLAHPVVARVGAPPSTGSSWRLEVRVADMPPRQLEGESCDALADAFVAMLSVQASVGQGTPVLPEPELPPPAVPSPPAIPSADEARPPPTTSIPAQPPPAEPRPARGAPMRPAPLVVLGIAAGVHGIGVPGPGGGIGVDAGIRYPHLRMLAYGRWWFRRAKQVVGPTEARYRLAVGGIEACGVIGLGRIDALGCGLGELGELWARGVAAEPSRTQKHWWVAPGIRLGAQWRARPIVRFGLSAVALAPLVRRRFTIGDESAGQVGPVELRGVAHVVFAIPTRRAKKSDVR